MTEVNIFSKQIIFSVLSIIAYFILRRLSTKLVSNFGSSKLINELRVAYTVKVVHVSLRLVLTTLLVVIWGIDYTELSLFAASVFTVVGVALFAQWSILSNITSSILIFFYFPYRIGDHIRVADKDDLIEGEIREITMFHVILLREDGQTIIYPNNLILQKAVMKK